MARVISQKNFLEIAQFLWNMPKTTSEHMYGGWAETVGKGRIYKQKQKLAF